MSASEIDKINKPELKRALLAVMKEGKEDPGGDREIIQMLKMILDEISLMREERKEFMTEIDKLRTDNETLRERVTQQGNVLKQHQEFMERIDAKERGCNLIVVGMEETPDQTEEEDEGKIQSIFNSLDTDANNIKRIKRLGIKDANKNRPILVVVDSSEERNKIVESARQSSSGTLRNIRVKKDAHPAVRAEWRRLFEVKEREEKKAENAGCHISIDMKKRKVMRDGQCIDSWCQHLF